VKREKVRAASASAAPGAKSHRRRAPNPSNTMDEVTTMSTPSVPASSSAAGVDEQMAVVRTERLQRAEKLTRVIHRSNAHYVRPFPTFVPYEEARMIINQYNKEIAQEVGQYGVDGQDGIRRQQRQQQPPNSHH